MAAVWCVERPTVMGRSDKFPLPDIGRVEFRDCIAGAASSSTGDVAPYATVDSLRPLDRPHFIRMVDRRGTPAVARRISVPKRGPTRDSLTVRFRS
jgi:hypothetical protein